VAERDCPALYPLILTLARTGMRRGEALALKWEDVDLPSRVVLMRRSTRPGITTVPKNGKSRRVDLSNQAVSPLGSLSAASRALRRQ
jgi:integrase